MKELIVTGGSVAYTTQTSFDAIASMSTAGELGFFNADNGNLVPSGTDIFSNYNTILPVIGRAAKGKVIAGGVIHQPININTLSVQYQAYTAPAAKISILGHANATYLSTLYGSMNVTHTLTTNEIGKYLTVRVINLDLPMEEQNRVTTYQYLIQVGDTSWDALTTNIFTKLVAVINADSNRIVQAATIATAGTQIDGIAFTSRVDGNGHYPNFGVVGDDLLSNATTIEYYDTTHTIIDGAINAFYSNGAAYIAPYVGGIGTPAQLNDIALEATIEDGKENALFLEEYMWKVGAVVGQTSTYDLFFLQWSNSDNGAVSIAKPKLTQELVIAVPASDANVAILKNMFKL